LINCFHFSKFFLNIRRTIILNICLIFFKNNKEDWFKEEEEELEAEVKKGEIKLRRK